MEEAVDLIGDQCADHVSGIHADEAPRDLVQIQFSFHEEVAAEEGAMNRRQGRDGDSQPLTEEIVEGIRAQLVGEHQTRVAWIGAADDRERRYTTTFNDTRIKTRDFRCAAHVEVQIAAPELLHAGRRLSRLKVCLDDLEIVLLVGADLFRDRVDNGYEIRIEHSEPDAIRRRRKRPIARKRNDRRGDDNVSARQAVHRLSNHIPKWSGWLFYDLSKLTVRQWLPFMRLRASGPSSTGPAYRKIAISGSSHELKSER